MVVVGSKIRGGCSDSTTSAGREGEGPATKLRGGDGGLGVGLRKGDIERRGLGDRGCRSRSGLRWGEPFPTGRMAGSVAVAVRWGELKGGRAGEAAR